MVRLGGEGPSDNFEDRTGQGGGGFGFGGGGGGGNMLGCLLPMVMSRFGIVGVLILLVGYCALTQFAGSGGGGLIPSQSSAPSPNGKSTLDPNMRDFLIRALGSTEETWGEIFQKSGARYVPTKMVAYSGGTQTACGMGQAAMGPFYCPNDKTIYIDPNFFNELSQRFGAPGDFAAAYVIAHEVGHHVQDLEGTLDDAPGSGKEDNFDADAAIATGELGQLVPELLEALGGEMQLGAAPAAASTPAAPAKAEVEALADESAPF